MSILFQCHFLKGSKIKVALSARVLKEGPSQ